MKIKISKSVQYRKGMLRGKVIVINSLSQTREITYLRPSKANINLIQN